MKEIIQKYLEEQCKIDTCLAEKYKDTLIDGCIEYINKMASEELKSQKKVRSRSRKYQIYLLSKSIKIFQKTAKNVCVSHFLR